MKYNGKPIEIIGKKEVFGKTLFWIKEVNSDKFFLVEENQINYKNINHSKESIVLNAVVAKIHNEVEKQSILAPYESSLVPLPHQILVLEKVMKSPFTRFLFADEVGMGKTIETGLVLKELKLRNQIKRVLIIVPKSAMLQWQSELKLHFNESFHVYDTPLIGSMAKAFSQFDADEEFNFWKQHNNIIVSTDALKPLEARAGWDKARIDQYNKYRMEAVLDADFDLLIIDEVHRMGGASTTVARFKLAEELCNTIPNTLLLSATPHRGKSDHFRRVLQLLDPDAFAGEGLPSLDELQPYVIRTEKRQAIDYEGEKLFKDRTTHTIKVPYDHEHHKLQMDLYESVTDYVRNGFNISLRTSDRSYGLVMILFQRMVSSSTAAIKDVMKGRLNRIQNGEEETFEKVVRDQTDSNFNYDEDYSYDTKNLNSVSEPIPQYNEETAILQDLIVKAEECESLEIDAKAEYLMKKYDELKKYHDDPSLKVLVFTEFRATQRMLEKVLSDRGYLCEIINGSMDFNDRANVLKAFKENSQVLIATDAAGESLNMQFAYIVFNYDLPWNPMILEQRIGRVDRIGQKNRVAAYNMFLDNSVDQRVYEVIETKLDLILSQFGIDKTSDVLDSTLDAKSINNLYLKSLLDQKDFQGSSDEWVDDIRGKLKDYQSTEHVLPGIDDNEISTESAKDIHYSPLPSWLKSLLVNHTVINNGKVGENLDGSLDVTFYDGKKIIATFNSDKSLDLPGVIHITLQHEIIDKIIKSIHPFTEKDSVPVINLKDNTNVSGYWMLWRIDAKNIFDSKMLIKPIFLSDKNKLFNAYAEDIWTQLIDDTMPFDFNGIINNIQNIKNIMALGEESLYEPYMSLEEELTNNLVRIKKNKDNYYKFQKNRISKIGIDNIRLSKLSKLDKEYSTWNENFKNDSFVIPSRKCLAVIRIENE